MDARHVVGLFAAIVLVVSTAQAQTNVRVRGTITAINGNVMSVKSRDGKDLQITIPDNVGVAVAKNVRFEDIKEGDYRRRHEQARARRRRSGHRSPLSRPHDRAGATRMGPATRTPR